jgi:diadenosine tetraphosphatase ApaH/serine/threonine PP2A family protein phosphatase
MGSWFPRPSEEKAIMLLAPSGTWTASEVLGLLTDPGAAEWPHKVGVAGPLDGSAKATTRLLCSRGWVCKTRVDQTFPSAEAAQAWVHDARAGGRRTGVWHPEKVWAVIDKGGAWAPLTICPELLTLRTLQRLDDRLAGWVEMLQLAIDIHQLHGVGLDVNPSNFGSDRSTDKLHYLDDDLYAGLDERMLGGAIVARIPEELSVSAATWEAWGARLREALLLRDFTWAGVATEIASYPLAQRWDESRAALLSPLTRSSGRTHARTEARRTCVIADVHANLPALEAVLADAEGNGATDYLFLGDAIGYGPFPLECVERIAELPRSVAIAGNHDHAIASGCFDVGMNRLARECADWTRSALGAEAIAWLGALGVEHVDDGWLAVHGAPKDPQRFLAYVYELTYEDNLRHLRELAIPICFYGHTHVQLTHVELAGGPSKLPGPRRFQLTPRHAWLVNPGSVGQPRDGDPRAAYAMWDRATGELVTLRVAYDIERTVSAIHAAGLPARLEERLRVGT